MLRQRTAVEHSAARIGHWQGCRARYRGIRKTLFDLRRTAVVRTPTSSSVNRYSANRPHDYMTDAPGVT
jgi:hypothetical protein